LAKVLAVDDDMDLVEVIKEHLESEHYLVECAYDADEGMRRMQLYPYDIVVLDWQLPGGSGVEMCRKFRAGGGTIPVLMLTARSHLADKEEGFNAGVDDYLTKPFAMKELSLRVRALLKRCTPIATDVLRARNIELDPVGFKVRKSGAEVSLFRSDFALLEFLMRNPNRVFNAEALLEHVYLTDANYTTDAIRTSIKRIRQKLDDEGSDISIIRTIHRVGYKLET
jgi:DNA-binding response OmpR family regulator